MLLPSATVYTVDANQTLHISDAVPLAGSTCVAGHAGRQKDQGPIAKEGLASARASGDLSLFFSSPILEHRIIEKIYRRG